MERYRYIMAIMAIGCLLAGCGNKGSTFDILPSSQSFKQSTGIINPKMDILWVIDNSGSMLPEQSQMTANYQSFIQAFSSQSNQYDFQMAVTTTDAYLSEANFQNNSNLAKFRDGMTADALCPQCAQSGVYMILPSTTNLDTVYVDNATEGEEGSGDERAFSSMRDALNSPLNSGFLRSGAFTSIIILSDEDDFSGANRPEYSWMYPSGIPDHDYTASTLDSVSSYVSYLDQITGSTSTDRNYNVSAIAVQNTTCQDQRLAAGSVNSIIGQRYDQMVDDVNQGLPTFAQGLKGDICGNYGTQLASIADGILSLATAFKLDRIPDPSTIVVTVNGNNVPNEATNPANNGGFTYDSTTNSIVFVGSAWIPPAGASINVAFAPAAYGQ